MATGPTFLVTLLLGLCGFNTAACPDSGPAFVSSHQASALEGEIRERVLTLSDFRKEDPLSENCSGRTPEEA